MSNIVNYVDSENDDADKEDNSDGEGEEHDRQYPSQSPSARSIDILNAERSFINCGYIGYKTGINL